jgi:hypothetical protein
VAGKDLGVAKQRVVVACPLERLVRFSWRDSSERLVIVNQTEYFSCNWNI